jgi:SAM-dependent methyltransferase
MVELAGMPFAESSLRILEPSAGTGAIINEIFTYAGEIHAIEINPTLAEELRRRWPAVKVRCSDFLECVDQTGFDFILMNPPFANGEDIKHIKHALTMLRPGGRLVAICANGPRQNEQLKPLVDEAGGEWEVLPPDTFKESGTGVNTVLLVMDADPEDDEPDPQPTAAPPDFGKGIFLATPDVDNRPIGQRAQPLPSMAPHIEEQKKVAAQRAGQNLTEQFNRPPKDITSKAGELERRAPLFHDTEASGQTRLF